MALNVVAQRLLLTAILWLVLGLAIYLHMILTRTLTEKVMTARETGKLVCWDCGSHIQENQGFLECAVILPADGNIYNSDGKVVDKMTFHYPQDCAGRAHPNRINRQAVIEINGEWLSCDREVASRYYEGAFGSLRLPFSRGFCITYPLRAE